jgi:trans-2,3-dihydro-3-hydroxyanthranilate isomerase
MNRLPFITYDVFTTERFAGNPLAIVLGAEDLTAAAMQKIASEFNLSETIFVCPPDNPTHTARVRIFTPTFEMSFAGHPTIGCAIHLARSRFGQDADIDTVLVLEENVGPVRCVVRLSPGAPAFAAFDSPKLSENLGPAPTDALVAQALGLQSSQIGFDHHRASRFSAGAPFMYVPVENLDALALCRPSHEIETLLDGAIGIVAYARLPKDSPHAFRVRMFAPGAGVPEDPATGSAAAAMAGVLVQFDGLSDGAHQMPLEQGVEMGRPSLIALDVQVRDGRLSGCRIGGHAVPVASGEILL